MMAAPTLDQYASETKILFQGKVKAVDTFKSTHNTWFTLIYIYGQQKPLALHENWQGTIPKRGDHISVEANEAAVWFFPKHHGLVITPPADYTEYHVREGSLPQTKMEEAEEIIRITLQESSPDPAKREVCGDDVYDELSDLFPDRDPRVFGIPFQRLAKRGKIHFFGYKNSVRKECHHQRIRVWHEGLGK